MLTGSIAGGVIAQLTNLGVPYILRAIILLINFATAFFLMKDLGFTPSKSKQPWKDIGKIFSTSLKHGLGNPPVRWLMLAAPFLMGVSFYIFYALQPFLLQLYGNNTAYAVAGMVAAISALAQIVGGIFSSHLRKLFSKRTSALLIGVFFSGIILIFVGFVTNFWLALVLIFTWGIIFAALAPIRQAYINGLIPSAQRATVLSFDSLMGSSGGIFIQPVLGRVADSSSYASSFAVSAVFQAIALPFIWLARREKASSDNIVA